MFCIFFYFLYLSILILIYTINIILLRKIVLIILKRDLNNILNNDNSIKSIITNWPLEYFYDDKYEIYTFDFFMEHKKTRKFIHSVPFSPPSHVILINSKNSGSFEALSNKFNSLAEYNKLNKSLYNHNTIYIRGYTYEKILMSNTSNYEIFYYKYKKNEFKNIDFYFDIFNPGIFQNYKEKYLIYEIS